MNTIINPLYPLIANGRHEIILVNSSITLLGYFYRSIYLQISHTALICIEVTFILLHAVIWNESGPPTIAYPLLSPENGPPQVQKFKN